MSKFVLFTSFLKRKTPHQRFRFLLVATWLLAAAFLCFEFISQQFEEYSIDHKLKKHQQKQLELLKSELDLQVQHLVKTFPAFLDSVEFLNKTVESTRSGPHFVYSPIQYGQPLDYWDRVQLVKNQVWMLNYAFPLIQSGQLNTIEVSLVDPHNNLIRNSVVPYLQMGPDKIAFFSYPMKGLFHQITKHAIGQLKTIKLNDDYFDKIVFESDGSETFYSSLGLTPMVVDVAANHLIRPQKTRHVQVNVQTGQIELNYAILLNSKIYNWKAKTKEKTAIALLKAVKKLDNQFLSSVSERIGGDPLAMVVGSSVALVTNQNRFKLRVGKDGLLEKEGNVQIHQQAYQSDWINSKIRLAVLSKRAQDESASISLYRSVFVVLLIALFFSAVFWIIFENQLSIEDRVETVIPAGPKINTGNVQENLDLTPDEPHAEQYLLIENNGESSTIPITDISHISVSDHYCSIYYLKDNQWTSWMIMERLKTFEERYQGFLLRINRSTLINPSRIKTVQFVQRKLIMEGEAKTLLGISQSALDEVKSVMSN